MSLLSLLGLEVAFPIGRKENKHRSFDTDVHHYENKKLVRRNADKLGNSNYWTVDSQFWT
jgi:hypothetical protein